MDSPFRSLEIRLSREDDVDAAKAIYNEYPDVFGWTPRGAFVRSHMNRQLIVCATGDDIVGFCRFYNRRDGVCKIYEMAVAKAHLRKGIGSQIVETVKTMAHNGRLAIELKCPEEAPANRFYEAVGFVNVSAETGKRKRLRVWRRDFRGQ